jgi:uncharacterized protein YbjT (DUF2867 family)
MILVTGATGTVGSELVRQLLARDTRFRVFVRNPAKAAHLPAHVERAIGDLGDDASLRAAMAGVKRLFLLSDPDTVARHLALAREAGVEHVVRLSTLEAGLSDIQLSRYHAIGEEACRKSGLAWTILKPGAFSSNARMWAPTIQTQGVVFVPTGAGRTSPIDPADIAAVAAECLTSDAHFGASYRLTGPELLTGDEQVAILSEVLGRPIRAVHVTPEQAGAGMARGGAPDAVVKMIVELWHDIAAGHDGGLTDAVERVTGRRPSTFRTWAEAHRDVFA